MTTHDALLPATVLQRKAVVYVRQSTPQQVHANLESQRRQYELVDVAHRRGFTEVEVIDDDLGDEVRVTVIASGFERWDAGAGRIGNRLDSTSTRGDARPESGKGSSRLREIFGTDDGDDDDLDVPDFLK